MNLFVFENSGNDEINDSEFPTLFRLAGCTHTFTLSPKSKFFRFGLRFTLNHRESAEAGGNSYNDPQIYHFEVCVGERNENREWSLPGRLQVQQYHFQGMTQLLARTEEYEEFGLITMTIHGLSDTSMNVRVSTDKGVLYEAIIDTFSRDCFHAFAWADFLDFKIECDHELSYNRIEVLSKASKAFKSDQPLTLGNLHIYFGANNCGKSSLLRSICKAFLDRLNRDADYIGVHRYIANSDYSTELETSSDKTKTRKGNRKQRCDGALAELEQFDWMEELALMEEEDQANVVRWYDQHFEKWSFNEVRRSKHSSSVDVRINNFNPREQGAGGRAILPIIIQLFNPEIELLAIDEPELGLEPRIQKILFDAIKSASSGQDGFPLKRIVVATHSHLFLDRVNINNNYKVSKTAGDIKIEQADNEQFILDATFNLLGANPSDLFFPDNIVVVEGRSDHIFLTAIHDKMLLLGMAKKHNLAFHFVGGFDAADVGIFSVEQMLKTQSYVPVYRQRICGIFDNPNDKTKMERVQKIRDFFTDADATRFVVLKDAAIEYYYPLELVQSLFGSEFSLETFRREVDLYLIQAQSHSGIGKFFGEKLSKAQLADKIAKAIKEHDNLPAIDQSIIDLITHAENLSF